MNSQVIKNVDEFDQHVARVEGRIMSYKHHPRQWDATPWSVGGNLPWVCLWTPASIEKLVKGLNRARHGSQTIFQDMGDHEGKVVVFRSDTLEKAVEDWAHFRSYMRIPKYFGDEEFVISGDGIEISCSLLCS